MPTYEYRCSKCKKGFDFFQSMKDEPLTVCPKEACQQKTWGKGAVKRQLGTGAGLIFKGSGFYITDYRSDGYKAAASKDKPSAVSTTPKAESKPEPKAAPASNQSASKPKTRKKD